MSIRGRGGEKHFPLLDGRRGAASPEPSVFPSHSAIFAVDQRWQMPILLGYHPELGDIPQTDTMIALSDLTVVAYRRRMEQAGVLPRERAAFLRWVRFYLDFCQKYGHAPREEASLAPFLAKLESKNQPKAARDQASQATQSKPSGKLETEDVKLFLSDLAVRHEVAASTQNQAFNALLFFYRHVLQREFGMLEGVVRAKRRPYVPVVLSRGEVDAVIAQIPPPYRLVVF